MMMMEGIKGIATVVDGGRGGRIGEVEDMGDGMQCRDHPYRTNPGGICAFCLQEKLGKLVSTASFPLPIRASSSSSSPSFRSDTATSTSTATVAAAASSLSLAIHPTSAAKTNGSGNNDCHYRECYIGRARIPFLLAKKKKKVLMNSSSVSASTSTADLSFKRSKSTTAQGRRRHFFVDADHEDDDIIIEDFNPRKRNGFWSFLYLSSKSVSATKKVDQGFKENHCSRIVSTFNGATSSTATAGSAVVKPTSSGKKGVDKVVVEDDDNPNSQATASASSFERKVSRSRSVGCGSRSFSSDFFERISTGLGDCTLRRVESQREGKPKISKCGSAITPDQNHHHCMKERVKCGGLFAGFMMSSSSSSSNSNSSCMVSTPGDDNVNGKQSSMSLAHGRTRSWGWAFASPMTAFSKHSSKRDITRQDSQKNTTPNLDAVPSSLAVRI